jgi:hypothetical protein
MIRAWGRETAAIGKDLIVIASALAVSAFRYVDSAGTHIGREGRRLDVTEREYAEWDRDPEALVHSLLEAMRSADKP